MVVGKTVWVDDRTQIRQLSEKRVGSRNRGDRHQLGSSEGVQRKCLTRRSAVQLRWGEMHNGNRNPRRGGGDCAPSVGYRGFACRLACNHHEICPSRGAERLSPRASGKKSRGSRPRVGIDENDVGIPRGASMLKCVVENDDIHTLRNRFPDSTPAIRCFDDRDTRIQPFVHQGFITAVATQHDPGFCAPLGEAGRYPGGHRGLSGAAD
jgi:hypothetical protein